jgi:hypothetical protein
VTDESQIAQALFQKGDKSPVVFVMQGPDNTSVNGRTIDGTFHPGTRHEITLNLDLGASDRGTLDAAAFNDPTTVSNALGVELIDSNLSDYVFDAVIRGQVELDAMGLNDLKIAPDLAAQQAGRGRNPQTVTLFVRTVDDDYVPA